VESIKTTIDNKDNKHLPREKPLPVIITKGLFLIKKNKIRLAKRANKKLIIPKIESNKFI
jgi:hypothetical protein